MQHTPGAAFIDVGAHYGMTSLPLMRSLGSDRRPVISVKISPDNIRSLALGIKKNGFSLSEWPIISRAMWNTLDETVKFSTYSWSVGYLVKE
jgi:hypothetical protein